MRRKYHPVVRAGRRGHISNGKDCVSHVDARAELGLSVVMLSDGTIALSAVCLGIALAGMMSALRDELGGHSQIYLTLVYGVFGGIASAPLVFAFAPVIYGFYLPFMLVLFLILPPTIFFYVAAKTPELQTSNLRWRDTVLPVAGVLVMIGFWIQPVQAKTAMFVVGELPSGVAPVVLVSATFLLIFCWVASSGWYLVATVRRLQSYRSHLRSLYSNIDNRELRWLDWFIMSLVVVWGTAAVMFVADNTGHAWVFAPRVLFAMTACLLLFVMAFASIAPPDPVEDTPSHADDPGDRKYARSALTTDHADQLAQRIQRAMTADALYLDPNLSLQKLSRHVGALPNQISQTLNENIGMTFFDFIAHHRIAAAKPLIAAGNASSLSVSLDVGFNSRSTFYKAFKRETGMTPKAYREAAQSGAVE